MFSLVGFFVSVHPVILPFQGFLGLNFDQKVEASNGNVPVRRSIFHNVSPLTNLFFVLLELNIAPAQ